jgi:3-oxoadipate enol-lactonase
VIVFLDGRRTCYDLIGADDAPVVCLVHSLTCDMGMWVEQIPPLLSAGFRVLRLDIRGHGGTEAAAGDYTIGALAEDVVALLDVLQIESVHFVGLSIGGMIGQALAIHHAERIETTVWCDTLARSPFGENRESFEQRVESVRAEGSLRPVIEPGLKTRYTERFKARRPHRWEELRRTYLSTSTAGYLGCCAAILDFDFREPLRSVTLPVLVVGGAEDGSSPPRVGLEISQLVTDGRFEEIPLARHMPNVEQPEVFNELLVSWLLGHADI